MTDSAPITTTLHCRGRDVYYSLSKTTHPNNIQTISNFSFIITWMSTNASMLGDIESKTENFWFRNKNQIF
jgi:hypothetical protein